MSRLTSLTYRYCCALLLLIVSISSIRKENFTSNDDRNDNLMAEREYYTIFTGDYNDEGEQKNFCSNSTDNELMNSANNNREDNDTVEHEIELKTSQNNQNYIKQIQVEINATFTNSGNDSTYFRENSTVDNRKNNTIQLCCPFGHRLSLEKQECIAADNVDYIFPNVIDSDEPFDQIFELIVQDPCVNDTSTIHFMIDSVKFPISAYYFSTETSSAYFPHYNIHIAAPYYCLAAVNRNTYELIVCKIVPPKPPIYVTVAMVLSLPFLFMTFVVYCILPDFRNMHGYTLRAHIASLFVAYMIFPVFREVSVGSIDYSFCVALSFVLTFSLLSSFFWLNVTCFDIWWTFGGFRSIYKARVKPKREKKTFVMYSMYAWGIPFFITVLAAIIEFVASPQNLIRPNFCTVKCWFSDEGKIYYLEIPVCIVLTSNICLFAYTALKILWYKRSTDHDLKGSQSQRHDDNKQRFLMYLKLFIVMGISWIAEVATWIFKTTPYYIWLFTDMINGLQGVIIFVIFVCKRKIIRLLLKRLGCKENTLCCASFLSSDSSAITVSTRSGSGDVSMQQIDSNAQSAPANSLE